MKKKGNVLAILTVLSLAFATLFYSLPDVVHAEENSQSVASVGGTNYGTLSEAISQANGQEIKLLKSITISEPIEITTDTVINGNSFQIDGSGKQTQDRRHGLFHMNSIDDSHVTLTLKNMKLVNNKEWPEPCGISVRASNQTLNLENVSIDTKYYCVFVGVPYEESEDINDVTVNINNSTLIGYSAVFFRTNSKTNTIMRPVLNVKNSELTGRGYNGNGNGFSTIVYNGTQNARATISDSTLSNSFDATNADADEGIIQFNCWGAYEEGAEITILHSKVKTHSTTAAPNIIKYTAGENLNVGNKVIIDDLTVLVDEHESDLIRVIRNGNELVATGKELDKVLSTVVPNYGDKPSNSTVGKNSSVLKEGDIVYVPINTTLTENAVVPKNVTVVISKNAKLKVNSNIKLSGSEGSKLVVEGTVEGLDGVAAEGTYVWQNNKWGALANSITLNKGKQTLAEKETVQLTATIQPENVVDKNVKWTSSNSGVASVDKNGKVTAVAPGKATITAAINGKTATCEVSVYKVEEAAILKVDPKEPVKEVTVGVNEEASQVLSDTTTSIVKEIVDGKSSLVVDSQTAENVKEAINNGETIQTKIEVKKVKEEKLDEAEVVKIEKALADKENVVIAEYLDLSVLLTTSDGTPLGKVNQLKEPIKFTIALPENLKAEGRTYYIVRVHGDKAELIEATLNKDGMLEFYTDQFSTYAIAYVDSQAPSITPPANEEQEPVPPKQEINDSNDKVKTGDQSNTLLYISIAGAAMSLAVVMITDKKRKELLNK